MPDVTVAGPGGSIVTIPIHSQDNADLAQAALGTVTSLIDTGMLSLTDYHPVAQPEEAGRSGKKGVQVTVPGLNMLSALPNPNVYLSANGGNATVAAIGGTAPATVVAGQSTSLVYINNSANAHIFLGGGDNWIGQSAPTVAAVINVDGSDTLGIGGLVVDASQGAATVNLFANAALNLEAGGNDLINAKAGSEILQIGGSSTVPVSVTGTASSNIALLNQASTFIEPGAGNFILLPGSTGTATLFGGNRTFGNQSFSAPEFTGSATVLGGTGYYEGGSAGNNILFSSTVTGGTTLIGAGNSDYLASFASGDSLVAGHGSEVLAGWNTTGTGNTFVSGDGSDTIWGSGTGENFIGFGSGNTIAYGQHNGSGQLTGNIYYLAQDGGAATIGDFLVGYDNFSLSLSSEATGNQITLQSLGSDGNGGTRAVLSDGSTITFLNNPNVTKDCFTTTT